MRKRGYPQAEQPAQLVTKNYALFPGLFCSVTLDPVISVTTTFKSIRLLE